MSRLQVLRRFYAEGFLGWFHRNYILDWTAVLVLWFLIRYIKAFMPVFERSFSLDDPVISHPHRKNQVTSASNQFVAFIVPTAIILVAGTVKRSVMDIHHGILGLVATRTLATIVVEFLKNRVGRLRPDFLARCKWDHALDACAGKAQDIIDGRMSFPSGHSSAAFSGMFYASIFIAGQTAAWCFHTHRSPMIVSSRLIRLLVTMIPLTWATHVALTRVEDNRHHKEDVIVGSAIGILSASICYLIFWPNPFSASNFDYQSFNQPRSLYVERQTISSAEYELTAVNDDNTNSV